MTSPIKIPELESEPVLVRAKRVDGRRAIAKSHRRPARGQDGPMSCSCNDLLRNYFYRSASRLLSTARRRALTKKRNEIPINVKPRASKIIGRLQSTRGENREYSLSHRTMLRSESLKAQKINHSPRRRTRTPATSSILADRIVGITAYCNDQPAAGGISMNSQRRGRRHR